MNGLRALVALVVVGLVWAAPAAAAKSFCGVRGRPSPGAGKLEWQPDGRLSVSLPGFVGVTARDGNTLYVAAGSSGNAISAIDLRTGRRLPFRAATPSGTQARHLAVSPTAVYAIAHRFEDSTDAILAFDRRTGARLAGFNVADFGDGSVIYSVTYVHGTVVLSGAPPLGDGTGLGAFDPATGAPVWRRALSEIGFEIRNVLHRRRAALRQGADPSHGGLRRRDRSADPHVGRGHPARRLPRQLPWTSSGSTPRASTASPSRARGRGSAAASSSRAATAVPSRCPTSLRPPRR